MMTRRLTLCVLVLCSLQTALPNPVESIDIPPSLIIDGVVPSYRETFIDQSVRRSDGGDVEKREVEKTDEERVVEENIESVPRVDDNDGQIEGGIRRIDDDEEQDGEIRRIDRNDGQVERVVGRGDESVALNVKVQEEANSGRVEEAIDSRTGRQFGVGLSAGFGNIYSPAYPYVAGGYGSYGGYGHGHGGGYGHGHGDYGHGYGHGDYGHGHGHGHYEHGHGHGDYGHGHGHGDYGHGHGHGDYEHGHGHGDYGYGHGGYDHHHHHHGRTYGLGFLSDNPYYVPSNSLYRLNSIPESPFSSISLSSLDHVDGPVRPVLVGPSESGLPVLGQKIVIPAVHLDNLGPIRAEPIAIQPQLPTAVDGMKLLIRDDGIKEVPQDYRVIQEKVDEQQNKDDEEECICKKKTPNKNTSTPAVGLKKE